MSQMIVDAKEAQAAVEHVLKTVEQAVTSTLGPNGRLAIIGVGDSTQTTKDGVTVARALKFEDPLHELINRVITEPAIKTDEECGDGTTTTIAITKVLTDLQSKYPGFVNQRQIEIIVKDLIKALAVNTQHIGVHDPLLEEVAMTSANQDEELAKMVVSVYRSIEEGYPDIELSSGRGGEDLVQRVEGRVLKMYYSSPSFGTHTQGGERVIDRFIPFVLDDRLLDNSFEEIDETFRAHFASRPESDVWCPVVLVVRSIELKVISALYQFMNQPDIQKWSRKDKPSILVMATNQGGSSGTAEMMDLASVLNAPMITSLSNIPHADWAVNTAKLTLGASRSKIDNLSEDDLTRINDQIGSIEKVISEYTFQDRFSLRARINERRLRNLRGQVVTILVGGETNQEIKERTDRYQDVVKALRSALENGILPGCGMGILEAARDVADEYRNKGLGALDPLAQDVLDSLGTVIFSKLNPDRQELTLESDIRPLNLATGKHGTSDEVGVWDTAYATITALKGGLQTAKILANTESVILTNKLHSRSITV